MSVLGSTSAVETTFRMEAIRLETSEQSRWQMLIVRACVCLFDAAMILPQSCSGAAPPADLGQTLRITVTFKKHPPTVSQDRQYLSSLSLSL